MLMRAADLLSISNERGFFYSWVLSSPNRPFEAEAVDRNMAAARAATCIADRGRAVGRPVGRPAAISSCK